MKSVLLIGLGRFGFHVAEILHRLGHEVMAVDSLEDKVNAVLPFVTGAKIGDSTSEAFLESLGARNFDVCFVTIGNDFQASLETTALLKEMGAKLVVARASREIQAKLLKRIGADEIVYPEKQLAHWTAVRFTSDHIQDFTELDSEHAMFEVFVPEQWVGRTLGTTDLRKKHQINMLAYRRNGKLMYNFGPEYVFKTEEAILVLGSHKDLHNVFRF